MASQDLTLTSRPASPVLMYGLDTAQAGYEDRPFSLPAQAKACSDVVWRDSGDLRPLLNGPVRAAGLKAASAVSGGEELRLLVALLSGKAFVNASTTAAHHERSNQTHKVDGVDPTPSDGEEILPRPLWSEVLPRVVMYGDHWSANKHASYSRRMNYDVFIGHPKLNPDVGISGIGAPHVPVSTTLVIKAVASPVYAWHCSKTAFAFQQPGQPRRHRRSICQGARGYHLDCAERVR